MVQQQIGPAEKKALNGLGRFGSRVGRVESTGYFFFRAEIYGCRFCANIDGAAAVGVVLV